MKSIEAFLKESENKSVFYAGCFLKPDYTKLIDAIKVDILQQIGIDSEYVVKQDMGYHVTTMYSVEHPDKILIQRDQTKPTAEMGNIALFGNEKYALVIKMDSNQFYEMNKKWRRLGCIPTYNEYSPHLTLCYLTKRFDVSKAKIKEKHIATLNFEEEMIQFFDKN